MSRMHVGRKGRASSKKPLAIEPQKWIQYKPAELKEIIVKLAKQGLQSSQIGLKLRDQYGVPSVRAITKKTVQEILKDEKLYPEVPEDLTNLIARAKRAQKHIDLNKKDTASRHGLKLIESKIFRLVKYYKNGGRLPEKWAYLKG